VFATGNLLNLNLNFVSKTQAYQSGVVRSGPKGALTLVPLPWYPYPGTLTLVPLPWYPYPGTLTPVPLPWYPWYLGTLGTWVAWYSGTLGTWIPLVLGYPWYLSTLGTWVPLVLGCPWYLGEDKHNCFLFERVLLTFLDLNYFIPLNRKHVRCHDFQSMEHSLNAKSDFVIQASVIRIKVEASDNIAI
jgi:hypothetical protein